MTSAMLTTSLASSSSVRILKRRYCDLSGLPAVKTTIEATVCLPWMVEMSKHSILMGGASRASALSNWRSASLVRLSS